MYPLAVYINEPLTAYLRLIYGLSSAIDGADYVVLSVYLHLSSVFAHIFQSKSVPLRDN